MSGMRVRDACWGVALLAWAAGPLAWPATDDRLARELARFVELWGGSFDNRRQTERGVGAASANAALRIEMRRVHLPAFGEHVFYVEWQELGHPERVVRQRLYVPRIDSSERVLRLGLHIWPVDRPEFVERTRGAHLDPSRLAGVTPADMVDLGDCDLRFRRKGRIFEGAMRRGACAFPAPDGTAIYSWTQMRVAPGRFEYLDGWFLPDGRSYRAFSRDWYRFTRTP